MQYRRPWFHSWIRKISWRRDRLPTPVFLGFPCGSAGKESACNVGNLGSIPGLGRFPGKGKGYPLQYSGLENSMDYFVSGVAKSWTRLSNFHFQWKRICLPSRRHGFDPWVGKIAWRRNQPTGGNPLQYSRLGNPHGQRSLVGCSPWGCKESDTTERLSTHVPPLTIYKGLLWWFSG